jgi:hypothetical protein
MMAALNCEEMWGSALGLSVAAVQRQKKNGSQMLNSDSGTGYHYGMFDVQYIQ